MIEVFLGDPFENPDERRVLAVLRRELGRRGVRARIYANFLVSREQRQVDLLIVSEVRVVHAELKTVHPERPLRAAVNGPWRQVQPDGSERPLGRHGYYNQAQQTTFALSDAMRELARTGEVPPTTDRFFRDIDTVLCLDPGIPANSDLARHKYIAVVTVDELIDRVAQPGPRPAWSSEHWDAFARALGVWPERPDDPTPDLAAQASVDAYGARFLAAHTTVPAHVVLPFDDGETTVDPVARTVADAGSPGTVVLLGSSGTGKSHTARRAAVELARAGQPPVWARCSEYQRGRLSVLLARSAAPYSTEPVLDLLRKAAATGRPAVVVLDGLNECPPDDRADLLKQVAALRLRVPVGVLVTTTEPVELPDESHATRLTACALGDVEREALLEAYGAAELTDVEAFVTPLDLVLAAECAAGLGAGARRVDLYDAFIARRVDSESEREVLRHLAREMGRRVRTSLTVAEVRAVAHAGSAGDLIDRVLACRLLRVARGRVAFDHELFGRFLAAEDLVLHAAGPVAVAELLRDPGHADLREFAVALQPDEHSRHELLLLLADGALVEQALGGAFGAESAALLRAAVRAGLEDALAATADATFTWSGDATSLPGGAWRLTSPRTPEQQTLLACAGAALSGGDFSNEIGRLFDVTDARAADAMAELHAGGTCGAPITIVVAATVSSLWSRASALDALPAAVVLGGLESARLRSRWAGDDGGPGPSAVWTPDRRGRRGWTRLYAALRLVRPAVDAGELITLFPAAWQAGGYHLRLEALQAVMFCARAADPATRQALVNQLEAIGEVGHVFLSSSLVEALAALDALEPMTTLADIRADIDHALARPDNPDAHRLARTLWSRQFEDERIVGPYSEAMGELDDAATLRLLVMAAQADGGFQDGLLMRLIADRVRLADSATEAVLRRAAARVDTEHVVPQEAVQAHVEAVRGWAALSAELPETDEPDRTLAQRAWRLVDGLMLGMHRGTVHGANVRDTWAELLDLCAPATVDVLFQLSTCDLAAWGGYRTTVYQQLVTAYPDDVLHLLEWAVTHRDRLDPTSRLDVQRRDAWLFRALGELGSAGTAAVLREFVRDPEVGAYAVDAVRAIDLRVP